jgi:type IV pilus assembly protein PilA
MSARLLQRRVNEEEGFTLVELLVVTLVIAILAAIAIPVFYGQRSKAYDAAIKSDLRNAATADEAYLTDTGGYATSVADLQSEGFKPSSAKEYWNQLVALTVQTDGTKWYCLTAHAGSDNTWTFDSGSGGILDANQGCVSST